MAVLNMASCSSRKRVRYTSLWQSWGERSFSTKTQECPWATHTNWRSSYRQSQPHECHVRSCGGKTWGWACRQESHHHHQVFLYYCLWWMSSGKPSGNSHTVKATYYYYNNVVVGKPRGICTCMNERCDKLVEKWYQRKVWNWRVCLKLAGLSW